MSNWLEDFREAENDAYAALFHLDNLSNILYQAGNEKVAGRLARIYNTLYESMNDIKNAIHSKLDEDYKQAQESSANILRACLAGVQLEKENRE